MNLKKAFRYQTLINTMISNIMASCMREDLFRVINVTYKKSELNDYALNKNYVDETKTILPGDDVPSNIPAYMFSSNAGLKLSSEVYEPKIVIQMLKNLFSEKSRLSEAIFKAKAKTKITPIGFESPITYDSAIALASTYRKFIPVSERLKAQVKDKVYNSQDTASVMTSPEQPLATVKYNVEIKISVDKDNVNMLSDYTQKASIFVEDLSDKIEAAALSAEVKFDTDLAITETIDSLYAKFVEVYNN